MKKLSNKMDDSKKEISDKLDKVNENIEDFKEFKTQATERLNKVEDDVEQIKHRLDEGISQADIEKVKNVLMPDLEKNLRSKLSLELENAQKSKLAAEVWEHEHALIIHGFNYDGSTENFKNKLFKEAMKVTDEILSKLVIKDIVRMGKTNAAKPPPISVRFAHPSQRNSLLGFSRNLPSSSNIKIDKSVPKSYKETYQRFKKEAWKLRVTHGYQAQIIFEQHKLVLRYKLKDADESEYDWSIYEEWNGPRPGSTLVSATRSQSSSKLPTPLLDTSSNSESSRMVILSKVETNNDTVEATTLKLREHFSQMTNDIVKIENRNSSTYVITCKDWKSCYLLAENFKKTKFNEKVPEFQLFCESDPNASN